MVWGRMGMGLRVVGWLLCWLVVLGMPAVWAGVHEYPEGGDRTMYRSLQTLRDRGDRAWQVVMFKRVKAGQVEDFRLRLVGFPGATDLDHPHDLRITALGGGTGPGWVAADVPVPYPANVGEYDVRDVMRQLDATPPLQLTIPLRGEAVELVVPPYVVKEWQQVKDASRDLPG